MIGVVIIAFDRPHYTRRLLASLEQQRDLDGLAFHLWQDGAVNRYSGRQAGDPAKLKGVQTLWLHASLPHKYTHVRPANVSIGIHQFEALEWMFDRYDRVIVLEDDVVLSPYWTRLARALYTQMHEWPNVFSFSLGWKRRCSRGQIAENLDKLTTDYGHWWGECLTRSNWAKVRPWYMNYYQFIRDVDYIQRDHEAILALFDATGWERPYTTQDGGREWAVWMAGMVRAVAVVNRGIGIGQQGMHFTPALFHRLGMDNQTPYIFDEDADVSRFAFKEGQ